MNNSTTLKATLILFLVIASQFTLKAQDSVRKIIVVVRPGQTSGTWTSYETPVKKSTAASGYTAPARKHVVVAPVTSERAVIPSYVHPAAEHNSLGTNVAVAPASVRTNTLGSAVTPPAHKYHHTSGYHKSTAYHHTPTGNGIGVSTGAAAGAGLGSGVATASAIKPVIHAGATTTTPVTGPNGEPVMVLMPPGSGKKDSIMYSKAQIGKKDSLLAKKDSLLAKKDSLLAKRKDTVYITKHDTVIMPPPRHHGNKIIFGEIGGAGLAISINYDQRIHKDVKDGLGFRIGAGYFADGGNIVFTIPIQVNYLLKFGNKDGQFFEFGLGTTFLNSSGDNHSSSIFEFDRVTGFIGTAHIGVRYEPAKSLNFRLGYVPILYDEGLINAGGFSVGYTF